MRAEAALLIAMLFALPASADELEGRTLTLLEQREIQLPERDRVQGQISDVLVTRSNEHELLTTISYTGLNGAELIGEIQDGNSRWIRQTSRPTATIPTSEGSELQTIELKFALDHGLQPTFEATSSFLSIMARRSDRQSVHLNYILSLPKRWATRTASENVVVLARPRAVGKTVEFINRLLNPAATTSGSLARFIGEWINTDPATHGMTRLRITVANDQTLALHGFGKCHPTDCDWSMTEGRLEGATVVGTYDFGFVKTTIRASREGDRLVAEVFDDFSSEDGRADQIHQYVLAKSSGSGAASLPPLCPPGSICSVGELGAAVASISQPVLGIGDQPVVVARPGRPDAATLANELARTNEIEAETRVALAKLPAALDRIPLAAFEFKEVEQAESSDAPSFAPVNQPTELLAGLDVSVSIDASNIIDLFANVYRP